MKVLSIKQPWATLIVEGYKQFEFRKWKTNFRGKFLIHASKEIEEDSMERFRHLNLDYPTGCIIGSAEIIECIEVNQAFEEDLISKNELIYGKTRGRSGYAFQIQGVEKYKNPIKARGQLGFWEYYNEQEIMELLKSITYGWIDKFGKTHSIVDESYSDNYRLQSPKEVMKSKVGVCWDQVELERYYFKGNDWNIRTFFIVHYDNKMCPSHTFLTFEKNGKYYWFEHAWESWKGIHEYNSMGELLFDVKDKFIEETLNNRYPASNLQLHEYKKPKSHISVQEFYRHCEDGTYIELETQ